MTMGDDRTPTPMTVNQNPSGNENSTRAIEIMIKIVVDRYLHQDRLLWTQIRSLMVLDAAVFASLYATKHKPEVIPIGLLGIFAIFMLWVFVIRIWDNRNANTEVIDELLVRILPDDIKGEIERRARSQRYTRNPYASILLLATPLRRGRFEFREVFGIPIMPLFRATDLFNFAFLASIVSVPVITMAYI